MARELSVETSNSRSLNVKALSVVKRVPFETIRLEFRRCSKGTLDALPYELAVPVFERKRRHGANRVREKLTNNAMSSLEQDRKKKNKGFGFGPREDSPPCWIVSPFSGSSTKTTSPKLF